MNFIQQTKPFQTMSINFSYLLLVLLFISACSNETTTSTEENSLSNLIKEEAIAIEPQVVFDQSQMTNKLLALCVKFKTLEGRDRKDVFNLFEKVLPSCPMQIVEKNEAITDPDNATQVMSIHDLKELLGEPSMIREDGFFVYDLMADGSYKVLFLPEANGSIACRVYEGDS